MNLSKVVLCSLVVVAAVLFSGCSTPKNEPAYSELPGPSTGPQTDSATGSPALEGAKVREQEQAAVAPAEKPQPIVTPDETLTGAVVSVNEVGRFVVLRFPLGRMPAEDSTLFVYRQGLKVAELKVTGPQKDDHTIADIRTGECRLKDEVRDR